MVVVVDDSNVDFHAGIECAAPSEIVGLALSLTGLIAVVAHYVVRRSLPDGFFIPPIVEVVWRPHLKAYAAVISTHQCYSSHWTVARVADAVVEVVPYC